MAIKKRNKKVISKAVRRPARKSTFREKKQYLAAFIVGVAALAIVAILFFRYAANNNYKDILGEQTYIEHQEPK